MGAFELAVDGDGIARLVFDVPGRKVNVFDQAVLDELEARTAELAALAAAGDVRVAVLVSGKRDGFIAGADVDQIAEIRDPALAEQAARYGQRVFARWAALPFPTVAAIRGTCVGGGTELALASTAIAVADRASLRIGLPEVRLGIVPAWGGCTRLPRRVGIAAALDLILTGRLVDAKRAWKLGLADALLSDATFARELRRFALEVAEHGRPAPRASKSGLRQALLEKNLVGRLVLFDGARRQTMATTRGHYPAALRAIEVVRVGIEQGAGAGFDAEARALAELATGATCKNLVHVFRLMEAAKKPYPGEEAARPVSQLGVLGAGVMGGGIAQLAAASDVGVRLRDIQPAALASGMAHASALFEKRVKRRRISRAEARRRMALVRPTLELSGLASCDLVVEAVVERLDVKQQVLAETAAQAPHAVLASNTSSLPVDQIASSVPDPGRVVGMHFFNPVDRMPLVEVVVGKRTAPEATATVTAFARALGKTPVQVADAPGFLVNRLLMFYGVEALWLLREGYAIEDLDAAMLSWGMPMGPLALLDEVGIDVALKVAHILAEAFSDRLSLPPGLDAALAAPPPGSAAGGRPRLGVKSGLGFYRYDGRTRGAPDAGVYALVGAEPRRRALDPGSLADRMVLPMVNEAARCLAERVVAGPGELDLAMILGTGFPPFRGGLCRWVDAQGPRQVLGDLERLASSVGARFEPSPAFRDVVAAGGFYAHAPRPAGPSAV